MLNFDTAKRHFSAICDDEFRRPQGAWTPPAKPGSARCRAFGRLFAGGDRRGRAGRAGRHFRRAGIRPMSSRGRAPGSSLRRMVLH